MGRGSAGRGQAQQPADPALGRLCRLPLVPRHGARELRIRRSGDGDERAVRQHQGRPRGAARRRRDLHAGAPAAGRERRLAAHHVLHAGRRAVLGRHLLPHSRALRAAELRRCAQGRVAGLPRQAAGSRDPSRRAPEGVEPEGGQPGHRDPQRRAAAATGPARPHRHPPQRGMRCRMGRLRIGAEVSLALPVRADLARLAARPRQEAVVRRGNGHARPHVPGRHLRPSGRRLRALRHRQPVADPAFREDALRQRPARRSPDAGLARDQAPALRPARRRDVRLGAARDDGRRRRLCRELRRRFRRRRGQVLRVGCGRDRRGPRRRRRGLLPDGVRRHG